MDKVQNGNYSQEPKKAGRISNIIALIICFMMATVMWLYVMQTESPEYEETFTRVPLVIEDVAELSENSKLSVISGWEQRVSVTVKGRRSDIAKYGDSDIVAYVSVGNITHTGTYTLDISVELPGGLQLVEVAPATAQIVVDEVGYKVIPVTTDISKGKHAADCELGEPVANPSEITVTGPVSLLENVHTALVKLELGEISKSVVVVAPVIVADKNGNAMDNPYLTTSVDSVSVTIPLYGKKTVPLTVAYKYGFYNEDNCTVTVDPAEVTLRAEVSVLERIDSIVLKTLDEKQITSDKTEDVTIPFPGGVVAVDGRTSAKITVKHKNTVQRTLKVTGFKIVGSGYTLVTEELDIVIRGPESILSKLSARSIEVTASLEDIEGSGEFRVQAQIKMPTAYEGLIYELGTYYINVIKK
ncbi:MAG: hypothetical protein IIV03_03420 [Clostridia bacterium]|nr:hypothetical protein [Clostridia bacterium]